MEMSGFRIVRNALYGAFCARMVCFISRKTTGLLFIAMTGRSSMGPIQLFFVICN